MASTEAIISAMLKENTGIDMLDSGGEGGRAWQRNQGRDFAKEPGSVLEVLFGNGEIIIQKSTYHYLTEFFEVTPESERLTNEFREFADYEKNKELGWLELMEMFFDHYLKPEIIDNDWEAYNISANGNVTNTYNYKSSIDQILQFMLFPWKGDQGRFGGKHTGIPYIMLQIHGGADARGGYTAPHIFAFKAREHEIDDFIIADGDYNVNVGEEQWYTDDYGSHWYFEGSSNRSMGNEEFAKHIWEYLGVPKDTVEYSMKFSGDIYGCSIDAGAEDAELEHLTGVRMEPGSVGRQFPKTVGASGSDIPLTIVAATKWSTGGQGDYPSRFVVLKWPPKSSAHEYSRHMQVDDGKKDNYFIYGHYFTLFQDALNDMKDALNSNNGGIARNHVDYMPGIDFIDDPAGGSQGGSRRIKSGNRDYEIVKATTWMKEAISYPFRVLLVKSYYADGRFHECATFMENQREDLKGDERDFYWGHYFPNMEDNEEYSLAQADRDFIKRVIEAKVYHPDVKVIEGGEVGRVVHIPEQRTQPYDVYLRGKLIDTVFYDVGGKETLADVKKSLVDHDGYDPAILVAKGR